MSGILSMFLKIVCDNSGKYIIILFVSTFSNDDLKDDTQVLLPLVFISKLNSLVVLVIL